MFCSRALDLRSRIGSHSVFLASLSFNRLHCQIVFSGQTMTIQDPLPGTVPEKGSKDQRA